VGFISQNFAFSIDQKIEKSIIDLLRSEGCIFAEVETQLLISHAGSIDDLMKMVEIRASGVPLEYVLGFTKFCGLRIEVERGVFVPRKRTEFLVQQAVALTQNGDIVVDLCCGSGAVGAALATDLNRIVLHSVDIDPIAVKCSSRNITNLAGHVYQGNLYDALPHTLRGRVNIIVANAPYVPMDAIHLLPQEARLFEPKVALDGGKDGLDLQRKVAEEAPQWLASGGQLLVETSKMQAAQTFEIFANAGLITKIARNEELDATVVIGKS
jgi:release factor glutamine methyltransferase